jgi:hypothetical protein
MAFRKYQKVEDSNVLSQEQHETIEAGLNKTGSKSVADLPEDERRELVNEVNKTSGH